MAKMIQVPCDIGDVIYFPDLENNCMDVGEVVCIDIDRDCGNSIRVIYKSGLTYWHNFEDFDIDVFTDEDKAYKYLRGDIK